MSTDITKTRKTGPRTRMSKMRRELGELFKLAIAQLLKDPKAKVFGAIEKLRKWDETNRIDGMFRVDDTGVGLFRLKVEILRMPNEAGELLVSECIVTIPEASNLAKKHPFRDDAVGKTHSFAFIYEHTAIGARKNWSRFFVQ